LGGLHEVHGGHVGYGLAIGMEEEVEGHAAGAQLGYREEWGDDGSRVLVVDEDLPWAAGVVSGAAGGCGAVGSVVSVGVGGRGILVVAGAGGGEG